MNTTGSYVWISKWWTSYLVNREAIQNICTSPAMGLPSKEQARDKRLRKSGQSEQARRLEKSTQKTRVNHLTHLSHSGSVHGQNDSKMCEKWVFLSVYWHTMAKMSQLTHLGFSVHVINEPLVTRKHNCSAALHQTGLNERVCQGSEHRRKSQPVHFLGISWSEFWKSKKWGFWRTPNPSINKRPKLHNYLWQL